MVGADRAARREQLIVAAFELVARVGFEGLRLRQVADAVGIDHSTLHHHVATKQELVCAVAEYATRQFHATLPEGADPAARLHGHLAALRALTAARPELLVVTAELDLRARRDPEVAGLLRGFEAGWRAGLVELLAAGHAVGAWAVSDPAATAELVVAAVKGSRLDPGLAAVVLGVLEDQLHASARGGT